MPRIKLITSTHKYCNKCQKYKILPEFYKDNTMKSGFHSECKECVKLRTKNNALILRNTVIEGYGGKCVCCGEITPEFLSIDHINNDGYIDRRKSYLSGQNFYRWIIKNNFPDNLCILCYNCNNAKAIYGVCPHEKQG